MSGPNLLHDDKPAIHGNRATPMVDWTILSPTFLTAVVEWAGAVVTVLAVGPAHAKDSQASEDR
jgi:hypothetical protein